MIQRVNSFKKVSYFTLIVLFLLIGVEGMVRVTGSGMGCPDWPTCFGQWVPPTCDCSLGDYHEIYKDHGYPVGTNFDLQKTWIQYFNRLLGIMSAILIMLTVFYAYKTRVVHRSAYRGVRLCVVMVMIKGVLGAIFVKLNLPRQGESLPYLLTILILSTLAYSIATVKKAESDEIISTSITLRYLVMLSLILTTIQLISGMEIRRTTERLVGISPYQWLQQNEVEFTLHRLNSLVILPINYLLWTKFRAYDFSKMALCGVVISLILQLATGVLMNCLHLPLIAQIVHLLLPAILFCSQFYILSYLYIKKETSVVST